MARARLRLVIQNDQLFSALVQGGAITAAKLGGGAMRFITEPRIFDSASANEPLEGVPDWCADVDRLLRGNLLREVALKFEAVESPFDDPANQFNCYHGHAMIVMDSSNGGSFGGPAATR